MARSLVIVESPAKAKTINKYLGKNYTVKASLGPFLLVKAHLKNAGATVAFSFDDTGLMRHDWNPSDGWSGGFTVLEKSHSAQVLDTGADSLLFRVGVPLEARLQVCIALAGCPTGPDSTATQLPISPQDLLLRLLKIRRLERDVADVLELDHARLTSAPRTRSCCRPGRGRGWCASGGSARDR